MAEPDNTLSPSELASATEAQIPEFFWTCLDILGPQRMAAILRWRRERWLAKHRDDLDASEVAFAAEVDGLNPAQSAQLDEVRRLVEQEPTPEITAELEAVIAEERVKRLSDD
jgi:hypothetical protein